jgi:Tol biopolymer transport system component
MRLAIGVGAFCASLLMAVSALAGSGDTQLTSRQSNGGPGSNGDSEDPAASASGRFVAFESAATNLSGVDGPEDDVFLYDHKKRRVTLVSRRSKGGPGADGDSEDPSVSASGRFVAYKSDADNLSGADSDGTQDVFVYDRKTKRTSLVSRRSGKNGAGGDANSDSPSISADGRHVAFDSSADNLIPAAVAADNVFVYDRKRRRVSLVSRESNGGPGGDAPSSIPQISGNGRFVSFRSNADNLSGADVANSDVFVYDRKRRRVSLVSRESNGGPGADQSSNTHSISGDGRYIAYQSDGTNLSGVDGDGHDDVFVYDRRRKRVVLVSRESNKGPGGDDRSFDPSISADGRFVAFQCRADNLSNADVDDVDDVMVYDLEKHRIRLASRRSNGGPGGNGFSGDPAISASGRFVAFDSGATNLSAADDDGLLIGDIFRHQLRR